MHDYVLLGRNVFHNFSKMLCFPTQSSKIIHLPAPQKIKKHYFFFFSSSLSVLVYSFQILLGCALLRCRRNDALSIERGIWGDFNGMLKSVMQIWQLVNVICCKN